VIANWKPAKGTTLLERREKRQAYRRAEEAIKASVRQRDGSRCRVPGCMEQKHGVRLEVAHLDHKGRGGDKQLIRTRADRMLCLCFLHHQGAVSHHSRDLRIEPETAAGTDGLCAFFVSDEQKKWRFLGVS
jgi:hypothetical protein